MDLQFVDFKFRCIKLNSINKHVILTTHGLFLILLRPIPPLPRRFQKTPKTLKFSKGTLTQKQLVQGLEYAGVSQTLYIYILCICICICICIRT